MTIKTSIELQPWTPPNFASASGKAVENAAIPVAALDAEALDALAYRWLEDLYSKAGKRNPFVATRGK